MGLPAELETFLRAPRSAVIATIRADGRPSTAVTWYLLDEGRLMLSMSPRGQRAGNLRRDPNFALTVLGDEWPPPHVSLLGRAVEFRDDSELHDIDRLSMHFVGTPFAQRHLRPCTVLGEIDSWHTARFA